MCILGDLEGCQALQNNVLRLLLLCDWSCDGEAASEKARRADGRAALVLVCLELIYGTT